jgi:hypothetical protein
VVGVGVDTRLGLGHPEVLQRGHGAGHPRLAGKHLLVAFAVKASGVQLVWSRMSAQSVSISSRKASRHAASCGESTSTPSTSKIAPRNPC